ncbi:MAG TPA: hypothetical protein PLG59_09435 [bacterium]|mgnify:CR=1 FL=1|nr:hypothetical protein [bacterium]HQO34872.1 hypothetical protein [bacterium]HQP96816.1 hypothetical protein [bacterium]
MPDISYRVITCLFLFTTTLVQAEETNRLDISIPYQVLGGEKSYWFGYYDKRQFDPSERYVLGMEVDFDARQPEANDEVRLGMFDLQDGNKWTEFGKTTSWCWQQGCMLQWLPGSDSKVIYNIRTDTGFGAVIQDVFTGEKRSLSRAIYTVSPNAKEAVGVDFARVNETRPGYGYCGVAYSWEGREHPADDGIYRVDLETGESKLIISLDRIVSIQPKPSFENVRHWFNHLLYSPDGTRFIFLHRWFRDSKGESGRYTRMFTANADGSGIHIVADHDMASHFIWRNPKQILAWSTEPEGNYFHLYTDRSEEIETIGKGILKTDGHCTYSPDGKWILTDTYPDKERMQSLMLFRPSDEKLIILGRFYLPPELTGPMRVDLHPRWSPDRKRICVDSGHLGRRQMVLLDVSGVMD